MKNLIISKKEELISSNEDIDLIDETLNKLETDFLNQNLPKVFAIVKDASRRLCGQEVTVMDQKIDWNMVHYDEQLIGGIVLHEGKVAEMKTGEGKTLVSTLPVVLNALTEEGVHVIAVNDYFMKEIASGWGVFINF